MFNTCPHLESEFLDIALVLAREQRQGHDTTDVHLRPVNMHIQLQLLADALDVSETFLVVGTSAAHPDLDLVLDKGGSDLTERADDTFEC